MKLGEITSCVGDMAVVSPLVSKCSVEELLGKPVFCDGRRVGRFFDVIGRVDSPFFVVRLSGECLPGRIVDVK